MKRWIALVLAAMLAIWQLPSQAQARVFNQAELDALLAPVALYPDPVLSNILVAATYPDELRDAAAWSRANPQLTGENAVRAAEPIPWHPSVKALLAFPDLLARMDESPQWTADLGAAFLEQEPYVMDTVQGLRRRAQASGSLQSNDQYSVQQEGSSIAVYPAQPQAVHVPYYNPYVVYGPWWWPEYRPVFWRPWYAYPTVFVSSTTFFVRSVDWHRRHVVKHHVAHHRPPVKHQHRAPVSQHHNAPVKHHHPEPVKLHLEPVKPLHAPANHHYHHVAPNQGDSRQRWREQQQDRTQRGREQQRPEVRVPRMNPPSAPVPSTNQPQIRQSRPVAETIRNQPQPAAQPRRPSGNDSAPARQVRQMVETIRNYSPPAVHAVTQPPQMRQAQPHFQPRGGQRQPGRQANHHSQRRG